MPLSLWIFFNELLFNGLYDIKKAVETYCRIDRDSFFSTKPFTKQQIDKLSKLPGRCNAQIVCDSMPEWAAPAVYYSGDGDKMVVATLSWSIYTRKGDADRAKDYNRRTDRAMEDYKTQMRYAANADDKAADYLRKAANALRK